jgi:hypothetical protein
MTYADVLRAQGMQPVMVAMEDILGRLCGSGRRDDFELAATRLQLQFERWTMSNPEVSLQWNEEIILTLIV